MLEVGEGRPADRRLGDAAGQHLLVEGFVYFLEGSALSGELLDLPTELRELGGGGGRGGGLFAALD